MNNNESLAHTKRDCTYHIVWIPKYRRKVLYGEAREEIRDVLRKLVAAKDGIEILEGSVRHLPRGSVSFPQMPRGL